MKHNINYQEVLLNKTEVDYCVAIGLERYAITSLNTKDRIQDKTKNPQQISIDGVLGEFAVARYLKLKFDSDTSFRKFGPDLIDRQGCRIDVKTTEKKGGPLNAVPWSKNKPVDVFVLCEKNFISRYSIKIMGWIIADELFSHPEEYLKPHKEGGQPYYSIEQDLLDPIDSLLREQIV